MACLEWLYLHHGWNFFLKLYLLYCSKMASLECLFHQDGWRHFWKFSFCSQALYNRASFKNSAFSFQPFNCMTRSLLYTKGKLWRTNCDITTLFSLPWQWKCEKIKTKILSWETYERWRSRGGMGTRKVCKMPVDNIFSRFSYNNFAS